MRRVYAFLRLPRPAFSTLRSQSFRLCGDRKHLPARLEQASLTTTVECDVTCCSAVGGQQQCTPESPLEEVGDPAHLPGLRKAYI